MLAEGQTFRDRRIQLDGGSFYGCTFERCVFVYSGLMAATLDRCTFTACQWEFQGPASETLGFLAVMYRSGARDLIERTFEQIRDTAPQSKPN